MRLGVEVLRRSDSVGAPSQNPETDAGGGGGDKVCFEYCLSYRNGFTINSART